MGDVERLRRLLDGDVDHGTLADNPMLASIAERAYGISVKPISMSKPSQIDVGDGEGSVAAPSGEDPLDLMIEVVDGAPPPVIGMGDAVSGLGSDSRSLGLLFWSVVILLISEIANLFGVFGALFGGMCSEPVGSIGSCPVDGSTRINLLSIGQINSGWGWAEPIQSGSFGIPDIVAIVGLLLVILTMKMRK